ncbi:MAG: DUF58 domain-containing protein [Eubacterium sp.]|nr:DUF58 domain-containing protein [Eubacterium sp.]
MWISWLIYILSLAAYSLFTILYGKQSTFIILFVIVFVPLLYSLLTWFLVRRGCRAYFETDSMTLEKNKKTEIIVKLECLSGLCTGNGVRVYISIYNGMRKRIFRGRKKLHLMSEEQTAVFEFVPKYSGVHKIVLEKVRVYSGFSLFCSTVHPEEQLSFMIMPEYKEFPVETGFIHEENEGESEQFSERKPGNDTSELYDIRSYRPGDKMNRINWKFSAKNDELMVQDYGFPIACDLAVFFDVSAEKDLQRIENALEILYYLMSYFTLAKKLFYVIWKDSKEQQVKRRMVSGSEDIYEVFQELFCTEMTDGKVCMEDMYSAQFEGEFLSSSIFIYGGRDDLEDDEYLRMKLRTDMLELIHV